MSVDRRDTLTRFISRGSKYCLKTNEYWRLGSKRTRHRLSVRHFLIDTYALPEFTAIEKYHQMSQQQAG